MLLHASNGICIIESNRHDMPACDVTGTDRGAHTGGLKFDGKLPQLSLASVPCLSQQLYLIMGMEVNAVVFFLVPTMRRDQRDRKRFVQEAVHLLSDHQGLLYSGHSISETS